MDLHRADGRWRIAALACGALFCCLAVWRYLGAGRDDTFITLWAGEQLGAGPWFVNYNLELEEISSSILHSLVLGTLVRLDLESVLITNKLFGLLCSVMLLAAIFKFRRDLFGTKAPTAGQAAAAIGLTATSPAFAYWTLGGLETPMQALILLLYCAAFVRCARAPRTAVLPLIALAALQILHVLVRSEGFWIIAVTGVLFVPVTIIRGWNRRYLTVVAVPALFLAALLAVRYHFTGLLFPNPTYAKIGSFEIALDSGIVYLKNYYKASGFALFHAFAMGYAGLVLALTVASCVRGDKAAIEARLPASVVAVVAVAADLFVAMAGGNWMEYFRFLVPTIPIKNCLLVWLAVDAVWLANRSARRTIRWVAGVACLVLLGLSADQYLQHWPNSRLHRGNQSTPLTLKLLRDREGGWNRFVELNRPSRLAMESVAPFVRTEMRQYLRASGHLVVVSYQSGYFPYLIRRHFSVDEVEFVDSMGLATKSVALVAEAKNTFGVAGGTELAEVFAHRAGSLSKVIMVRRPNLGFTGELGVEERRLLETHGWRVVWDHPAAIVVWRPRS